MKRALFSMTSAMALIAITLIGFSPVVDATNAWKMSLTISSIVNNLDGGFLLIMEASDPACGSSGNQFNVTAGRNGQTVESVKTTLALALTAYSLGKKVNVVVDNALSGCPVQILQISP